MFKAGRRKERSCRLFIRDRREAGKRKILNYFVFIVAFVVLLTTFVVVLYFAGENSWVFG